MPMWRCPHCGTPQAETARCWVCRRSSTACATCQNFRRSVAGALGYCGLDRQRGPLRGDEIRGCWEAAAALPEVVPGPLPKCIPTTVDLDDDRTSVRRLEFVEVRTASSGSSRRRVKEPVSNPTGVTAGGRSEDARGFDEETVELPVARTPSQPRWSLWGEEA